MNDVCFDEDMCREGLLVLFDAKRRKIMKGFMDLMRMR